MTTYTDIQAWLDAFRTEPDNRLARILRSADSISPFQRGDPHDAIVTALRTHGQPDDLAAADQALARWIEDRLTEPLDVVAKRGWGAYVTAVMEGFALASRLPGESVGALLRNRYEEFEGWTGTLSDEGPGDLRARYLLALAHNQGRTRRFLGLWYGLCDGVGRGTLSNLYLTIGLTGLRGLPHDGDPPPVGQGVEGLCRWARHLPNTDEARERFLLQWRAFMGRHPRQPGVWQAIAAVGLETYGNRPFAAWWREELGLEAKDAGTRGPVRAPTIKEQDQLVKALNKLPPDALEREVIAFADKHEIYAISSNDWRFIHKALNVVGNALLKLASDTAIRLAAELATTVLNHVPNDEHSWVLWADALERLGQRDAAESVLWRGIERAQKNAHLRTTLAGLIAGSGRADEAEALYRDTMLHCPKNVAAPGALAALLAETGYADEAITLYRNTLAAHPDDPPTANALAHLLAETGKTEDAVALYRATKKAHSKDAVCRLDLGLLLLRLGRRDEVPEILAELDDMGATEARTLRAHLEGKVSAKPKQADDTTAHRSTSADLGPEWEPMLTTGRALRAKFLLSPALDRKDLLLVTGQAREALRAKARAMLEEALRRDPNNPVVRLIARRYKIAGVKALSANDARRVAARDFDLRLELANRDADEQGFVWLYEDFEGPVERALTAMGWLKLNPYAEELPEAQEAAKHLHAWLRREEVQTNVSAVAFVHADLRTRLKGYALGHDLEGFLDGFQKIPAADRDALVDIALLGRVLDAMPLPITDLTELVA